MANIIVSEADILDFNIWSTDGMLRTKNTAPDKIYLSTDDFGAGAFVSVAPDVYIADRTLASCGDSSLSLTGRLFI